jgi:hypothetical protein
MRACAASRAVAARASSSASAGTGFGSWASRLPRSNVKGVGLLTATGLCVCQYLRRDREEGLFETHSRPVAVESATERAALLGASTSMAPPLILSTRCECVSSAMPPVMSISRISASESAAVVLCWCCVNMSKKVGTTFEH